MYIQRLTAADGSGQKLATMHLQYVSNLYNRMRRLSDAGTFSELRKFGDLRKEFYDQLWRKAARNVGAEFTE